MLPESTVFMIFFLSFRCTNTLSRNVFFPSDRQTKGVNNILCIGHNLQIIIKIKIITLCWAEIGGWIWRKEKKSKIISAHRHTTQLVKLFYANYFQFFLHILMFFHINSMSDFGSIFFLTNIICNKSIRDYRVRADKLPIRLNAAPIRWLIAFTAATLKKAFNSRQKRSIRRREENFFIISKISLRLSRNFYVKP